MNADYEKAKELGLTKLNRWGDGINHHPMSVRLLEFMANHDFHDHDDYMCIKRGGDGDNGEHMMYLMDAFFEMMDISENKDDKSTKENQDLEIVIDKYYWVKSFNHSDYEIAKVKDKYGNGTLHFCFTDGSVIDCKSAVDYKGLNYRQ